MYIGDDTRQLFSSCEIEGHWRCSAPKSWGHKLFFQESDKQKTKPKKNKGTTKMLSKDRLLWMGSIAFIVKCTLIF